MSGIWLVITSESAVIIWRWSSGAVTFVLAVAFFTAFVDHLLLVRVEMASLLNPEARRTRMCPYASRVPCRDHLGSVESRISSRAAFSTSERVKLGYFLLV